MQRSEREWAQEVAPTEIRSGARSAGCYSCLPTVICCDDHQVIRKLAGGHAWCFWRCKSNAHAVGCVALLLRGNKRRLAAQVGCYGERRLQAAQHGAEDDDLAGANVHWQPCKVVPERSQRSCVVQRTRIRERRDGVSNCLRGRRVRRAAEDVFDGPEVQLLDLQGRLREGHAAHLRLRKWPVTAATSRRVSAATVTAKRRTKHAPQAGSTLASEQRIVLPWPHASRAALALPRIRLGDPLLLRCGVSARQHRRGAQAPHAPPNSTCPAVGRTGDTFAAPSRRRKPRREWSATSQRCWSQPRPCEHRRKAFETPVAGPTPTALSAAEG